MDTAGGMDWQAKRLEGKVFSVRFIDSAGQIHLEETGLALILSCPEIGLPGWGPTLFQGADNDTIMRSQVPNLLHK